MSLTFGIVLHGILQILHDALLANHLLDPCLSLDVKGIGVELLNLSVPLRTFSPVPVGALGPDPGESLGIRQGRAELGALPAEFTLEVGIAQDLEADDLGVLCRGDSGSALSLGVVALGRETGGATDVADVESEHVAVGDLELGEGPRVVGDELAIVVEVLGGWLEAGLGVDRASEGVDGHVGVDFEGEQVLVIARPL